MSITAHIEDIMKNYVQVSDYFIFKNIESSKRRQFSGERPSSELLTKKQVIEEEVRVKPKAQIPEKRLPTDLKVS